jgi:hypothetical protein
MLNNQAVSPMRDNPIALIEFVAFIGLVLWLLLWQRRPTKPGATQGADRPPAAELKADGNERSGAE